MVSLCSLMPSSAGDDVALAAARKKNENTFRNIKFQRFSGLTGSVYFDWAWSGVNWMYQGGWLETSECCWWGGWAATWTCLAQVWTLVWGNGFDSIHPVRVVGRGKHWSSGYICWMSKDSVSTHKNYIHDVSKRTIWFQKDRYFLKHIWYSNSSHTFASMSWVLAATAIVTLPTSNHVKATDPSLLSTSICFSHYQWTASELKQFKIR